MVAQQPLTVETEYQERFGKFPSISKAEAKEQYSNVLVCDCGKNVPLVPDPAPIVNVATNAHFFACPICKQHWLFVISSREVIKGQ